MWGKNSSTSGKTGTPETTYMAKECQLTGKIKSQGTVRIDGTFEGELVIAGDLLIGPSAVIKGNIKAVTVSISGEVRGDIIAEEKLELTPSARLQGDIFTKALKIDQGAQFVGNSRYLEDHQAAEDAKKTSYDPDIKSSTGLLDEAL